VGSVENRVVQMTFDNSAFQKNIADTIKSLGKLDTALANTGSSSGLGDLAKATKGFNLNPLATSISGISTKFLALSTIGITALSNIVNKAVDAGLKLAKSLSLDQITSGFQEYETNMKSIQTILANTKADGTNLQQVNGALDELNSYADQTIYNFAEMARNIGTFTAAGVDLDTSVASIKGIANAAAISGSTSQQASTAMYQLSQAIASGSLKLMDWNSVVNAGMGGEVMQKALFDTGKAMGTLVDVPIDQSFDDWKDSGNSFRESLQEGWITTDVLTTTLKAFGNEISATELKALGFTDQMISEFAELGETGVEAATKVRTFTQLMDTAQEAVGSGWSQTFRIVLGDFEEATKLFTGISEAFGSFAENSAKNRNDLLQGWKDLGGRTKLIRGLKIAFENLGKIMEPIRKAFRSIFPPKTAEDLLGMTESFLRFAKALEPGKNTVKTLKIVFKGFFSALAIGWEIIKQGVKFIGNLIGLFTQAGGGAIGKLAREVGRFFIRLKKGLVDGEGIADFFDNMLEKAAELGPKIIELKDSIVDFFKNLDFSGVGNFFESLVESISDFEMPDFDLDIFGALSGRFEFLGEIALKFQEVFNTVTGFLGDIWDAVSEFFGNLGSNIADTMSPRDFDAATDVISVGLLGGIAVMIRKFMKDGLPIDFGGGILNSLTETFESLTGVLKAMTVDIKAGALLKIAGAIAILTASVLVLSLIDSAALAKALTAMAVGMAQLMGAFVLLNKIEFGPRDTIKMTAMAIALGILGGAMLLMAASARVLAKLNWDELARGLTGIAAILLMFVGVAKALEKNVASLTGVGTAMLVMAGGILLLSFAVQRMGDLSWTELGKGLLGMAVGLGLLVAAVKLMPENMHLQATGLIAMALALNLIAMAVERMGNMGIGQLAKGLGGMAVALGALVLAMTKVPQGKLFQSALGILAIGLALQLLTRSVLKMAELSWEELGKGVGGLIGVMLGLAVAMKALEGTEKASLGLLLLVYGLGKLSQVITTFAAIPIGTLVKGVLSMVAALATLAITAYLIGPAIPFMIGLGVALLAIGAGFALFGLGAAAVANALLILVKVGKEGSKALVVALEAIGAALPALVKGFAKGLVELVKVFADAAPELVGAAVAELLITLIDAVLKIVNEKAPDIIEAGINLLLALLQGIKDNIGEITTTVLEIIVAFIGALADNIADIVTAGVEFIIAFISGIIDNFAKIGEAVVELVAAFISAVTGLVDTIIEAGVDLLVDFLSGIIDNLVKVTEAVGELIAEFISAVGGLATDIADAGAEALADFLDGIADNIETVATAAGNVITTFITEVVGLQEDIVAAGLGALTDFLNGIANNLEDVIEAAGSVIVKFIAGIAQQGERIAQAGVDALVKFLNAIVNATSEMLQAAADFVIAFMGAIESAVDNNSYAIGQAAGSLAGAIASAVPKALAGFVDGIAGEFVSAVRSKIDDLLSNIPGYGIVKGGIGLITGQSLDTSSAEGVGRSLSAEMESTGGPTITPVVNLSEYSRGLSQMQSMTEDAVNKATAVYADISGAEGDTSAAAAAGQIVFNQTNNSPEALSTADIYRQTRNQVAMAKEELKIAS